jgi:hypothetical protein
MTASPFSVKGVGDFVGVGPALLREWIARRDLKLARICVAAIVAGAGVYGAVMGSWRDPMQAVYTGIKLPLVMLLTTLGNGLLNGMLAPLLGFNVSFRQSLTIVLTSFAITAVILGALSPVALFLVWNTPPLTAATRLSSSEYNFLQLTLAAFIATAGMAGNVRLVPLVREWAGSGRIARNVLFAWLAVNLFLGSQICWVLRPFLWEPAGPVRFIGREYLRGSFFETVFEAVRRVVFG